MSQNAKKILKDIVEQQRSEGWPEMSLSDFFEVFAAQQITKDFDLSHEELEHGVVDGEHDGGIDSVYTLVNGDLIFEDTDLSAYKKNIQIDLVILQSKTSGGFSEEPINKAITALGKFLDLNQDLTVLDQYNETVRDRFEDFRTTYTALASKFPSLTIAFHYTAMAAADPPHKNTQKKMADLSTLIKNLFDEATVIADFAGAKELLALARRRPSQTFQLKVAKSIPTESSYMALASLTDYNKFLRNGEMEVRHDLFESNVRDFQGSTEVNSEIQRSLSEQTDTDFWWLNNGVTILSSDTGLAGSTLTLENPQIVNGLQTSSQIAQFFDDGGTDEARMVLIKVISSDNEDVRDSIIKATNSQNSVPQASLRATDRIQRDIEHSLKVGGYFYDRRKNFYKNQGKPAAKIVSIPLLAQAAMTLFINEPNSARARPSSLIKSDAAYSSIFSEDYPVDAYLVAADLIKRIDLALKARNEFRAVDRNNLRFYCLLWLGCVAAATTSLNPEKIAKLKGKVTDTLVERSIDKVQKLFFEKDGSDQLAKGPDFKEDVINSAKKRIIKIKGAP